MCWRSSGCWRYVAYQIYDLSGSGWVQLGAPCRPLWYLCTLMLWFQLRNKPYITDFLTCSNWQQLKWGSFFLCSNNAIICWMRATTGGWADDLDRSELWRAAVEINNDNKFKSNSAASQHKTYITVELRVNLPFKTCSRSSFFKFFSWKKFSFGVQRLRLRTAWNCPTWNQLSKSVAMAHYKFVKWYIVRHRHKTTLMSESDA